MFFDGLSRHSIYTRRLDVETLDAASVSACPVLLQEEIPRIGDVRATFVGKHCFVADSGGPHRLDSLAAGLGLALGSVRPPASPCPARRLVSRPRRAFALPERHAADRSYS